MSCIQATSICKPCGIVVPNRAQLRGLPCTTRGPSLLKLNLTAYKQCSPRLQCRHRRTVVCVLGGKDKSENEKPWEVYGKVMEDIKGQSIEDVLRHQMKTKEYYDGSGGKGPPWRRGRRGGGGGGDGSGESKDDGHSGIMDETLQQIKATIVVILVYIYIINFEELNRLLMDYIKYLSGGKKSVRLRNAMEMWGRFWERLNVKKLCEKFFLQAIINTATWHDSWAKKYKHHLLRSYMASQRVDD